MLDLYQELADSSRRSILLSLRKGTKSVSELVKETGLRQPNVSNHLARLRSKDLVECERSGRTVCYRLSGPEIDRIVSSLIEPPLTSEKIDPHSLAEDYAKFATAGDECGCASILEQMYQHRIPILEIYEELLTPAMTLVGQWYKAGKITEAHEHLASEITRNMMARTLNIAGINQRNNRVAVLGCAAGNHHVIGLSMIGDYLKFDGWKTLFIGANTPEEAFLANVKENQPDLVLISCACEEGVESTLSLIRLLDRSRRNLGFKIVVGGYAVIENTDRFLRAGADAIAKSLRQFSDETLSYLWEQ